MNVFDVPWAMTQGFSYWLMNMSPALGLPDVAPAGSALILIFLIMLNGFFVASEFAIVKARAGHFEELIEEGHKAARMARHIRNRTDAYLSAAQLGITLSSLSLGWLGEPYISALLTPVFDGIGLTHEPLARGLALVLAFGLIATIHVVFGELVPKSLALRYPIAASLWTVYPLRLFYLFFRPFVWVLNRLASALLQHVFRLSPLNESELAAASEEDLRLLVEESEHSDEVSPVGREILLNALDLSRRVVRDIMTPRNRVVFLDVDDPIEKNIEVAVSTRHTRFPLCRGHLDATLGLVHIKDVLASVHRGGTNLEKITRELLPVPETMALEKLLTTFLAKHAHIALVVDEYGGAVGMVTLDNVLAELVGDIQDEFDHEPPEFVRLNEEEFLVSGGLGLYELEEHTDLELESTEVSTIGGYVTHLLGHLPKEGEEVRIEHYLVRVSKMEEKSIGQLHFKQVEKPRRFDEEDPDDEEEAEEPVPDKSVDSPTVKD
ncbi:MAG: hemolysin family protein [Verrucomicrobiales bacterium]